MAGTVGSVACDRVMGEEVLPALRSTTWQIPGQDGYGIHIHGMGDSESQFTLVRFGNDSGGALNTWYSQIRALQGTVQTIVNDQGKSIPNQFIVRVNRPSSRTANNLAGITRRLECTIQTITV